MEIMTTTVVHHNKEMDPSGGNVSFWEDIEDEQHTELNKSLKMVSLVIHGLVFVLGVLGNGVVIWVTGFRMKKTANVVWYPNLAAADFLVTAFLPLGITYTALDSHWPFGTFMCKLNSTVLFTSMYASIYVLAGISVDRCVCVVRPVWARNHRSVRKASWVSLGVWALSLALSSPYFIFRDTRPSVRDKDIVWCYDNFALTDDYGPPEVIQLWKCRFGVMVITRFLVGFAAPFTVIVSCYSVVVCRLRNNRSLAGQSGRPFKIIAAVVAACFLCWAPYHVMYQIDVVNFLVTDYSQTVHHVVTIGFPITTGLASLNSCLNPLLYVFMVQGFKDVLYGRSVLKALEKAFTEELPQGQSNTSTNPGSSRQETAVSETQV